MFKTIFIPATFKEITELSEIKIETGEVKKNWLGVEKKVYKTSYSPKVIGYSDKEIDGNKLSENVNKEIIKWEEKGFRVISIVPITSGSYNYQYDNSKISSRERVFGNTEKIEGGGSYGFGYGYSYTEGVLICMEQKNE